MTMPDLPPPVPTIEFSLASRGMSKGIAQTTGPQFLARGELGFGPIYVGGYVKNVDSTSADGEAGASLGLRKNFAGFDLAASATLKLAIDPSSGSDDRALEISASAARKLGRLTPRLSVVWSPDDLGSTRRTSFAEAGVGYRLAKTLTASAAVGRREREGGLDYMAWNAGLAWNPVKPLTLDARYYDTDGGSAQPFRARGVVTARVKL
jgi:opacity protein-like surface antigen